MKKSLLIKMNLQFFAADTGSDGGSELEGQEKLPATDPDPTDLDDSDGKGSEGKTFTRDEVAKMIAAEKNKAQKAWEKEQQERQAKAERQAKMTAEEKIKEELEEKDQKIAEYEREKAVNLMSKEASKMFSDASLPHDDDLLSLIVSDDIEATIQAVAIVTNYVSMIKKENARKQTPSAGGQFSADPNEKKSVANIAASTRIIK
ncbi:capsid assembly scaffolding protein Gp46 family protein [Enterococcus sp. AZ126]|uniref:capsid assembly scaffolding protein Gp46 family protein n=1 Tax=Enterococcus sp. AZ126 TaxID=2774635 RepID=UPI003F22965A